MRYLLVDFGASYIKTVVFETTTEHFSNQRYYSSPFLKSPTLTKQELLSILENIVSENPSDGVVICTVLGGHYEGDVYHSWKSSSPPQKNCCLISGLFVGTNNFHIHEHHQAFTTSDTYQTRLRILGQIRSTPIYSSLGDTYCAINSIRLNDGDVGINMGTGSQVFYQKDGKLNVTMYIPSGRAFLTFQQFFQEFQFDMFSYMDTLSTDDVVNSTLEIDLNVFERARTFVDGGSISHIVEGTFTKKNLVSSVIRSYVLQYKQYLPETTTRIYLLGGISRKIPCLTSVFEHYYPDHQIVLSDSVVENTHLGMANFVKEYLYENY